jgi:hypothetical protein
MVTLPARGWLADRRIYYGVLLVIALPEWITLAAGVPLVSESWLLGAVAISWTVVALWRVPTPRLQGYAVEILGSLAVILFGSMALTAFAGIGVHYWTHAHPLGTFLTAWWRVSFYPAVILFLAEVIHVGVSWIREWRYLSETTPEERVLE